ncbi:prophage antirepressor [Pseudomonas putida]|uniref:Bro-N domain-containing protein n=1 Tax=Pseudomonas putida TaxID=303 RepID=A0A379KFS2_PSEPU|nr:Bro-N domain-containing protein [Pseudomonas putida]NWC84284.1 Bro-N domain-containing protein [Pseudomonas putida]SUD66206.1 prophage antirepressor [Pseudomonas putida]
MTDLHTSTLFTRHNRPLHTLWLESQAWFCAHELGRLSGHFFDEHCMRKLDPDQYRTVQLLRYGQYQEATMVSESGAYTLLAHHHVPENRHLRWWLTHEVVAVLRDAQADRVDDAPRLGRMCWPGGRSATLLYWQSEPWVRMRDMPVVLAGEVESPGPAEKRKLSWRECAQRALRMHGV